MVCFDDKGRPTYPAPPAVHSDQTVNQGWQPIDKTESDWSEARRLEYIANDPAAAAKVFATIAQQTDNVNLAARALQAQGRCLVQSGDKQAAIELITTALADKKYAQAVDLQGRSIVPNAQLMALQLMDGREHPALHQLAGQLQKRLNDYDDPAISGFQRHFLMQELKHLLGDQAELPFLPAEDLAARFIELKISPLRQNTALQPSPLPGIWQLVAPNGRLLALWHTETIVAQSALGNFRFQTARQSFHRPKAAQSRIDRGRGL